MQDWDDLRFFLAVALSGSINAAADKLAVNQSTVSRRINAFEAKLNVRLFERLASGYELTSEGDELLDRALRIQDEVHAIDRHVMGKNVELNGPIRVTTTVLMARYFLIPILDEFYRIHSGIVLHLDLSNNLYNLTAREADVALRVTRDPVPESLVGRNLGNVDFAVYAENAYMLAYEQGGTSETLHWIGEDTAQPRPAWIPDNVGNLQLVARTNDVLGTLDLIKQGLGVGRLPCFVGDKEHSLRKIFVHQNIPTAPVWLLTHADMRRVKRVQVFNDFVADKMRMLLRNTTINEVVSLSS